MHEGLALDDTPDVFRIARFLVSRAIKTHGTEIDLVGYYGSYAQGVARATSDLDIFYVPADGKNPPVGRTLLVEGILFDFWAIDWCTLEGFATGRSRGWAFAPAIVHHAKLLHTRSAEQAARFAALKQKVLALQNLEARPQMIQRALDEFQVVLAQLGNLRLAVAAGDLVDVRYAGWKLILAICECLALANQVFFDRGWDRLLEQIPRLQSRPEYLTALIEVISTSEDLTSIANAAERLALDTRQLLRTLQQSLPSQQTPRDVFESSYPETKDGIRKVLTACERRQPIAASVAAWAVQSELSLMLNALQNSADHTNFNLYNEFAFLYRQLGFPDLMHIPVGDLSTLAEQARTLDMQLRQWLQGQAVDLCEFETLADLARLLK